MQNSELIAYFLMIASITLAPGPWSAILTAKTLAGDRTGATAFAFGIALGDLLAIGLVCAGLGTWLQAAPVTFTLGKGIAIAYVLWVAYGIVKRRVTSATREPRGNTRLLGEVITGITACIASPQTVLLYLLLIPGILDLKQLQSEPFLLVAGIAFTAMSISLLVIIYLAEILGRWIRPRSKPAIADWVLASFVAGTGLAILAF